MEARLVLTHSLTGSKNGEVHNDRARIDVPVGMLANGLRVLGFRDIGAGGSADSRELPRPGFLPTRTRFRRATAQP